MPKRYQAPQHVSSIFAPTRPIPVDGDGTVELADDAPEVEHETLRRAGCVPISGDLSAPEPNAGPRSPEAPEAPDGPEIAPDGDVSGDASAKGKTKAA